MSSRRGSAPSSTDRDRPWSERLVRAILVSTIYGGASEIQRGIIAKTLGL